jgi:hypothetical protein
MFPQTSLRYFSLLRVSPPLPLCIGTLWLAHSGLCRSSLTPQKKFLLFRNWAVSKAPALFMPIATWPVNRYHVKFCSLGTAHPSILTILKLFTTLLQGFTLFSFSFFTPTIAFYFTLQVAVAPLTLSLKTNPWKVSPIRRFDRYA